MRHVLIALCTFLPALITTLTPTIALAQDPDPRYVIHIEVDRPVLEPGQTTEVRLRAGFNSDEFACMAGVAGRLLTSVGGEGFHGHALVAPMNGPGTEPGVPTETGFSGIIAGQISGLGGAMGDPSDPIGYWRVDYTAPIEAVGQTVSLETATLRYEMYTEICYGCTRSESRIGELVEGAAAIRVVACRADFNGDGRADVFDFLDFINAYLGGQAAADFDFDGELTVFDFVAFQDRFDRGCEGGG
ncbi:MAG: GC-type dockerin domain-anchored protein [Phycisphaerales bacterium JB060]